MDSDTVNSCVNETCSNLIPVLPQSTLFTTDPGIFVLYYSKTVVCVCVCVLLTVRHCASALSVVSHCSCVHFSQVGTISESLNGSHLLLALRLPLASLTMSRRLVVTSDGKIQF